MFKFLLVGIWVCVVTLGTTYTMMTVFSASATEEDGEKKSSTAGLEPVRMDPTSVPVVRDGKIQGYVVATFVFTVESKVIAESTVPVGLYFKDRAFKQIYSNDLMNFDNIKKQELEAFTKELHADVNKKLGAEIIKDVLVEQFDFVPLDQVRCKRDA